jgi:hypothetical protein
VQPLQPQGQKRDEEMQLRITGDIPASLIEQMRKDLSSLLPIVVDRAIVLQQSHLPPAVRLIGEQSEWINSLRGAARVLLAELTTVAGRAPERARIAAALSDKRVEPLKKVAQTLCGLLAKESQRSLHVGVGLAIPNWQHSTTLKLQTADEESAALALARFISELSDVEAAIREEIRGPRKPYGQVQLEVMENGPILLRWLDEKDLSYHQREIPPRNPHEALG